MRTRQLANHRFISDGGIVLVMDQLERLLPGAVLAARRSAGGGPPGNATSVDSRALVHASLSSAVGRRGRHLTGTFCLTGDTMEGIIQCLVFLKAFSVC